MSAKIVADSSCDLNEQLREELNISIAPLTIQIDDKLYIDDEELRYGRIYGSNETKQASS